MRNFRDMSMKSKLMAIILLTSVIMLLLASSAFVTSELLVVRRNLVADLFTLAEIVGINSGGGIVFNDKKAVEENMAVLKAKPHVMVARVFTKEGIEFAHYLKKDSPTELLTKFLNVKDYYFSHKAVQQDTQIKDNYFFHNEHNAIEVFKRIIFDGEVVGTAYVQANLDEVNEHLIKAGMIVTGVTLVSLLLAFFIASRLQRVITKPVHNLLNTMAIVATKKDYTIHAQKTTDDELGSLVDGFNNMLGHIAARDQELNEYHNLLEEKVMQRTAEVAEARDQALAANKAKSTFLANMSHELRTPLNGILGYAQILARDKTLGTKQQDGISIIQRSGEYLLTLINDVLDLSKIEAGRVDLYPIDFHFDDFLNGIIELFQMRAEQKGISFIYESLSHLPIGIHADEKRLRQILINLLGNAVKFTSKGGVTLKVGYHEGKVRFQIEDTGVGIATEELDKIFLPFQQAGDQNYRAEGTGLGLSITKTLIEMMGGELHVESTLGRGSIFWAALELPEVPGLMRPKHVKEPVIVGFQGKSRKILVIDDKWENRSVLVNLLTPLGFEIIEANNGQEGLQSACAFIPDLIITDLVMPVMDGFECARQIRNVPYLKNVPIIAASASVFEYHQQGSLDAGCNSFIAKPFRAEFLLALLQKHLTLTWIYEQPETTTVTTTEEAEQSTDSNAPLVGPTPEQAATLYELAMMGDIQGIVEQAEKFAQENKQLNQFVEKIRQLAKGFQEEQICELVSQYMNTD